MGGKILCDTPQGVLTASGNPGLLPFHSNVPFPFFHFALMPFYPNTCESRLGNHCLWDSSADLQITVHC